MSKKFLDTQLLALLSFEIQIIFFKLLIQVDRLHLISDRIVLIKQNSSYILYILHTVAQLTGKTNSHSFIKLLNLILPRSSIQAKVAGKNLVFDLHFGILFWCSRLCGFGKESVLL